MDKDFLLLAGRYLGSLLQPVGEIEDPTGIQSWIATHVEDMFNEELLERA